MRGPAVRRTLAKTRREQLKRGMLVSGSGSQTFADDPFKAWPLLYIRPSHRSSPQLKPLLPLCPPVTSHSSLYPSKVLK